jgi:hypothetical protein
VIELLLLINHTLFPLPSAPLSIVVEFQNSVTGSNVSLIFDYVGGRFYAWMFTDGKTLEYYTSGIYDIDGALAHTALDSVVFCSSTKYTVTIYRFRKTVFESLNTCLFVYPWPRRDFYYISSLLPLFITSIFSSTPSLP